MIPNALDLLHRLAPPERGALVRHRPGRARYPVAHHLGLAHLGHRRLRHRRPSPCSPAPPSAPSPASPAGGIDTAIMRVMDVLLSFPAFVMAMALAAALGPDLTNAMLAIAVVRIPFYVRLARGQALSLRERPYVKAAETFGASRLHIVIRHIIPNAMAPIIVQSTLDIGVAILTASALSFIGLGAQQPTAEWGAMVGERPRFPAGSMVVSDLPRPCHPGDGGRVQPAGRRAARHLRSAGCAANDAADARRRPSSRSRTWRSNSRPIAAWYRRWPASASRWRRARSSGWWANPARANRSPPCPSSACCPKAPCGSRQGQILLLGQDVLGASEAELRDMRGRLASMIFQEPMNALNPTIRIGRQIVQVIRQHEAVSAAEAASARRAAADRDAGAGRARGSCAAIPSSSAAACASAC